MKIVSLNKALADAATAVYMDRQKADAQYGAGLFDRAIEHHVARNLRADTERGITRDRGGQCAAYVSWSGADAAAYIEAPHFVYFDFFRGHILNSVSRLSRGLSA